ncbi:MAG TPA: helix-turn-helix domain-containing protein [Saprospiraceae bacterium]|nr:helix-turn-helix domain-containing protein [Saprospiraceae bacterium]HPI05882.1 helix-turn-helix domain-containing protein [Saprospiraceae bacterium]
MQKDTLRLIFGLKIHLLRQQQGLTLQQLAEKTGTVVSYLHDIEKGKKYPSTDKIVALAAALHTTYDALVAVGGMKQLQPIIDLLESAFFKTYPLELFGLKPDKILEMLSDDPSRISAFLSTILKISRSYHMRRENLYSVALRSYQDMHDNYFPEIEAAARLFRESHPEFFSSPPTVAPIEEALRQTYDIQVDRNTLPLQPELRRIRSYYSQGKRTLFLNAGFSVAQERFLLAREIGFQALGLTVRPYETIIQQAQHFDHLLHNFHASYFASALLMPPELLAEDIRRCAGQLEWNPAEWLGLLERYQVTPEMLLQRFTNVLPGHFGLKDLFFLRIEGNESLNHFTMTKELHLSGRQSPYATENGHYCRRWVSVEILRELRVRGKQQVLAMAQISSYYQTENEYCVISMAKPAYQNAKSGVSVTLGLRLTDDLRRIFKFAGDPAIIRKAVGSTCETCAMPDCESRAAAPSELERETELANIALALKRLD